MKGYSPALEVETCISGEDLEHTPYSNISSATTVSQEINRAFKDFNVNELGFLDSQYLVCTGDGDDEVNTYNILKIHLLRLQLLVIYFVVKQTIALSLVVEDIRSFIQMFSNIIWFSYFTQIDKFVRLLIKFFSFATTNIDSNSINFLFDLLPKKIPHSITIVEYSTELALLPPPPVPRPYLDNNKRMVIPPNEEVAAALNLQSEYVIQHRVHNLNENIRILNNFIKLIVWSSLINVETIQLVLDISYENLRSMITKEFQVQLGTMNYDRGIVMSHVPLIRINDVVFDPLDSLDLLETDSSHSNEWEDDTRKEMQVLLEFKNTTQLTIFPHAEFIKFNEKPELSARSTIIFQKPYNFSFKWFILSLHHYQKNKV